MPTFPALRLVSLAALAVLLVDSSHAQSQTYYYGGFSAGQSETNLEADHITQGSMPDGATITDIKRRKRDMAYKIFGGYQFNANYAIEGGYFYLGKPHFQSTVEPTGGLNGRVKVQGWNLDLVGLLPMTESLSLFARIGAQYAKSSATLAGSGSVVVADAHPTDNQLDYKGGLGLQYEITPAVLVRGEFERYRVGDGLGNHNGVNVASVSLVFPFGRAPKSVPHAQAEPAYVAPVASLDTMPPPAAAPAPVVVAMAAPEVRRVSFSAESLFSFDDASVGPEGQTALDTFAKDLSGTRYDMVNVEGHTDRLGTAEYNDTLSLKRAEAVKAYLVNTGGLDAAKVTAVGKGESTPVTSPDTCKGNKRSAGLVACLRADRRVELEVVGTR
jgi:OOP family OmpA-OmpF porin